MDWIECLYCEEEFKIITDSLESVAYCPFCGEDVEVSINDDEDEEK